MHWFPMAFASTCLLIHLLTAECKSFYRFLVNRMTFFKPPLPPLKMKFFLRMPVMLLYYVIWLYGYYRCVFYDLLWVQRRVLNKISMYGGKWTSDFSGWKSVPFFKKENLRCVGKWFCPCDAPIMYISRRVQTAAFLHDLDH